MDLSQNLPQQARLETEARYHKINGDWTQAVEIYSHLQRSYPDNLDYGLDVALAQNAMGKSVEAAATITAFESCPLPSAMIRESSSQKPESPASSQTTNENKP